MVSNASVEAADRISRKRSYLLGVGVLVFIVAQALARPVFPGHSGGSHFREWLWAINAAALLLILATGGGLMQRSRIRALVNDEVAARNRNAAVAAGFWIAMLTGLAVSSVPSLRGLSGTEAAYLIVTAGTALAVLVFATLEFRAHHDA